MVRRVNTERIGHSVGEGIQSTLRIEKVSTPWVSCTRNNAFMPNVDKPGSSRPRNQVLLYEMRNQELITNARRI